LYIATERPKGKLYAVGGDAVEGFTSAEAFDPLKNRWEPEPRARARILTLTLTLTLTITYPVPYL